MSMRPFSARIFSTSGSTVSVFERSQAMAVASTFCLARCATASSSSFCFRAVRTTLQPISPSASATCRPSPREPPVITATRPVRSNSFLMLISRHLEQSGRPLTATDAHRHHHQLGFAALAFDQRMADQPCAAHAIRMADRDRAAIHVQPVVRYAELVAAVDHLHREGLVQFPEVDILDLQPVALEQLGHGEDRADAHLVRFAPHHLETTIDTEWLEP